jgi:hypothetical protein
VPAVGRRSVTVPCRPPAIRGSLRTVRSRLVAHLGERLQGSNGPGVVAAEILTQLSHLPVVRLRDSITLLRHAIPPSGDLVTLLGLLVPLEGHLGPYQGRGVSVEGAPGTLGSRQLKVSLQLRIARGTESRIAIGGGLISLRGTLVDLSLCLIAVGCALIGVRGSLILVRRCLIGG